MKQIFPAGPDSVTDDQLAAMSQAVGRSGGEPWLGDMSAALECCDRGWLSIAHLPTQPDEQEGVFYLITARGAAVMRREDVRRRSH